MKNHELDRQLKVEEEIDQAYLESLLNIPLPIIFIERDKFSRYILFSYNQFAQEIFAVPLERLINKEIRIFWPKESWDDFRKGIIATIRKSINSDVDSVLIKKEGRVRSFSIKIWKVAESIACCIFLETIDKKLFTQAVLNERLKYEELFKNTPVMMLNVDLNGNILDVNLNWIAKTGYDKEELIGQNIKEYLVFESNFSLSKKNIAHLLVSNELQNFPVQIKKKNLGTISSVISARPLFDINGKFIRCYLFAHDVSELKSIQSEYENIEKLLNALLENSATAILVYSPTKGIVECNSLVEKLLECKRDELIGKKLFEIEQLHKLYSEFKDLRKFLENSSSDFPQKIEFNLSLKNQKRYFELILIKIHLKEEPFIVIFIVDKSLEKIKEEKIQETEKQFQTLFEESINALRLIDTKGKVQRLNKKAKELFGDYIDKRGMVKIKTKDFDYQKWLMDFINSERQHDQIEYKIDSAFGEKFIRERILKVYFDSGSNLIFSIASDITQEKIAEEELKKREKNLRNFNDPKNRLIYILSHDLRAPTSSIIGIVNAILEESKLNDAEIKNYLRLIKSASSYQLDLINNLLDWSLIESGKFNYTLEPKNLKYAIHNSINSVKGLLNQKKIKLDVKVHSNLVLIDLNLFSRIMINLLSNAIKFSYPESKIWISTKLLSKNKIEISIKDNGIGFDKEVFKKLFTFSEKVSRHGTAGERGTGLGLSISRDMIKILGGKLKIQSPVPSSNKKTGSLVSFDLKLVEPKIFITSELIKKFNFKLLKQKLTEFKFVIRDLEYLINNNFKDYYLFVILNQNEKTNFIIEKIFNIYRTVKNIIVITENGQNLPKEIKKTTSENLYDFLLKEISRIEFEWKQQMSLANQMKKMWA